MLEKLVKALHEYALAQSQLQLFFHKEGLGYLSAMPDGKSVLKVEDGDSGRYETVLTTPEEIAECIRQHIGYDYRSPSDTPENQLYRALKYLAPWHPLCAAGRDSEV